MLLLKQCFALMCSLAEEEGDPTAVELLSMGALLLQLLPSVYHALLCQIIARCC